MKRADKPSFAFNSQTYLKLTDTTATPNVRKQIQKQWGSEYIVVLVWR